MKKILFGITSLTLGGAERVLVDIVNELCIKYEITIFTIYAKGELEKQLLPQVKVKSLYDISYEELTKFQKIYRPLRILLLRKKIYNKYIKGKYDVEIAFLEGPVTRLLSVKNKAVRKIAWIHNDISAVFGNEIKSKLKRKLDYKIYNKYKKLVFVSKDNMEKFKKIYPNIKKEKEELIYNYINKEAILKKAEEKPEIEFPQNEMNFVTIARLVPQKAIDRIIKIHSKLMNEGVKCNFYVIGDGPEKEKLENQIKDENIKGTFSLLGKMENPYPYIKMANYFCLLSKFEGYGMVLEEAKMLNKPIIITDTAAREAVEGYKNSVIVENSEEGIYKGLKQILQEKTYICNNNVETYNNKNILEQIERILEE